jgi:hypothetical protein
MVAIVLSQKNPFAIAVRALSALPGFSLIETCLKKESFVDRSA